MSETRSSRDDIDKKSLPKLKSFLGERGVKTTGYKKHELAEIAIEAIGQKVPPKPQDDSVKQNIVRRTVNGTTYPIHS